MELYVIRHGESQANAQAAHAGWSQVPLTETGIAQARHTAALLKAIRFDKIITSDLVRAIQTAEYVFPDYEFQTDSRIREISVGALAGHPVSECRSILGESYERNRQIHDFTPYGGENMDQLLGRVADFMESLQAERPDAKIAAVCHGGAIFAMLCHVLGHPLERHAAGVANCGVCVFGFAQGRWSLHKWNETGSAEIRG